MAGSAISKGERVQGFLLLSMRHKAEQDPAWPLTPAGDPPKPQSEQEQHYHSFTAWEGEADLQPPINLGWCKIINPHLLVWFEQDFLFFLKQKHMLIDGTFFSFCRFMLILMNCLCKNKKLHTIVNPF